MAAYAKGAPVRIIGAEATGAADYWYAKTSSPIKTLQDTNGHTIAFSTQARRPRASSAPSSTSSSSPPSRWRPAIRRSTLTAVMTDQVDVGWASPPFGLKEKEAGQIRVIAKATDAALVRGQTIRVIVANAQALEKRKDAIDRFMDAYRETIDYMYSDNPQVLKDYADFVQVPEATAKRVRDEFFPKSLVDPDEIKGLDSVVKEAVNLKFIGEPLTQQQLDELDPDPHRERSDAAPRLLAQRGRASGRA